MSGKRGMDERVGVGERRQSTSMAGGRDDVGIWVRGSGSNTHRADSRLSKFSWGHAFFKMNGHLIARYRTCNTHEEVAEMQETIQREQQEEHDRQRAEKDALVGMDLLRANPNHVGRPEWDDETDEEESEEEEQEEGAPVENAETGEAPKTQASSDEERDDVEALVAGVAATTL